MECFGVDQYTRTHLLAHKFIYVVLEEQHLGGQQPSL